MALTSACICYHSGSDYARTRIGIPVRAVGKTGSVDGVTPDRVTDGVTILTTFARLSEKDDSEREDV